MAQWLCGIGFGRVQGENPSKTNATVPAARWAVVSWGLGAGERESRELGSWELGSEELGAGWRAAVSPESWELAGCELESWELEC